MKHSFVFGYLKNVLIVFALIMLNAVSSFAISPEAYQARLGVGINVNWLNFDKLTVQYQKAHNKGINVPFLFERRGFSHVRIRVKHNLAYVYPKLKKSVLRELRLVVKDCFLANITPIITYDAADFRKNPNMKTLNEAVSWWKGVAKAFKHYPDRLSYDLIIETSGKIKKHNELLNLFYKKAIKAIRQVDKKRILFITPNGISNPYNLPKLWYPKNDKFIMIEWHFYAAGPSKTNKKKLWTIGTKPEKELIINKINFANNWCKKHKLYDWVGAWMPTNYNKINRFKKFYDGAPAGGYYSLKEEIKFACFVSESLKKYKIPYAVNADIKFFSMNKFKWYDSVKNVVDAILDKNICKSRN